MSNKRTQRPRRTYSDEFKAEVVESVRNGTHTVAEVCRNLELTPSAVRVWLRQAERGGVRSTRADGSAESEREELARLRAEVRQLKMERDILKKATAFFAKEST